MSDISDISVSGLWRVLSQDLDPVETKEWLDAFDAIVQNEGQERATFLLRKLLDHARMKRVPMPPVLNTPYANTVPLAEQPQFPGNPEIEARISALVRWNALAMVVRANRANSELGGHVATYASSADLFEVGLQPFLPRRPDWRRDLFSAAFRAGRLCPRLSGRPLNRRTAGPLSPGNRWQRAVLLLSPLADARVLAISHRLDGAGCDQRHLSGAFHALSRGPRNSRNQKPQSLVLRRRWRNGRTGIHRRPVDGGARRTGQPDFRGELQLAAARRSGARQRFHRAGARRPVSPAPAGTSSR